MVHIRDIADRPCDTNGFVCVSSAVHMWCLERGCLLAQPFTTKNKSIDFRFENKQINVFFRREGMHCTMWTSHPEYISHSNTHTKQKSRVTNDVICSTITHTSCPRRGTPHLPKGQTVLAGHPRMHPPSRAAPAR